MHDRKGKWLYTFTLELVLLYNPLAFDIASVDATYSKGCGRRVNDIDTTKRANAVIKIVFVDDEPKLCLFASVDIKAETELRYDYGVQDQPWRKMV